MERKRRGILAGLVGIFCNFLLCAFKLMAGIMTKSVSIMTDAINNLSDSGSSVVTVFSFEVSSKRADREHPHGHGRFEYVASFVVGFLILFAGLQFLIESIKKIINPSEVNFSVFAVIVLCFSIAVKLFMMVFYRINSKKLDSSALSAAAMDSMFDVLCSLVVLVSFVVDPYLPFRTDGFCGGLVALFVLFGGGKIVLETARKLLGNGGSDELFGQVYALFEDSKDIVAAHDLKLHEYGHEINIGSIHVEMDKSLSLLEAHDIIHGFEQRAKKELNVDLVIHIDPVDFSDAELNALRKSAYTVIAHYHGATVHDAQIINSEQKLSLHVKLPSRYEKIIDEVKSTLLEHLKKTFAGFDAEVSFEIMWK